MADYIEGEVVVWQRPSQYEDLAARPPRPWIFAAMPRVGEQIALGMSPKITEVMHSMRDGKPFVIAICRGTAAPKATYRRVEE